MEKPVVPKFATEAEEADWWDQHLDVVDANFIEAVEKGTLRRASETELGRRVMRAARRALAAREAAKAFLASASEQDRNTSTNSWLVAAMVFGFQVCNSGQAVACRKCASVCQATRGIRQNHQNHVHVVIRQCAYSASAANFGTTSLFIFHGANASADARAFSNVCWR
jgi:hypothetical protein